MHWGQTWRSKSRNGSDTARNVEYEVQAIFANNFSASNLDDQTKREDEEDIEWNDDDIISSGQTASFNAKIRPKARKK